MADDKYTFEQARIRLEEIAAEVRKKDTSLEKSLDLLEEGVRLANICTELVDHTDMSASVAVPAPESQEAEGPDEADRENVEAVDTAVEAEESAETETPEDVEVGAGTGPESFDEADDEVIEPADAEPDE